MHCVESFFLQFYRNVLCVREFRNA